MATAETTEGWVKRMMKDVVQPILDRASEGDQGRDPGDEQGEQKEIGKMPKHNVSRDAGLHRENAILRKVIRDTLWMARRYADHRATYAPAMYNDAVRLLEGLGIEVEIDLAHGTKWAREGIGQGRGFDGLSDEEARMGGKNGE